MLGGGGGSTSPAAAGAITAKPGSWGRKKRTAHSRQLLSGADKRPKLDILIIQCAVHTAEGLSSSSSSGGLLRALIEIHFVEHTYHRHSLTHHNF